MTILLIGSKGQLGQEVEKKGKQLFGSDFVALDLPEIDITDQTRLDKFFSRLNPSLVINTAAYTAVDAAEIEKDLCYRVNMDGPSLLARFCFKNKARLIHISTDYVFDGSSKVPYRENDPVSPLGVYGKSKAEGEKAVLAESADHMIIRTSWLYGRYGKNFVKTMLRLGKEKKMLQVVNDQYGCPTCAADLAQAVLDIAGYILKDGSGKGGIYHYCGKGITTWYDFAVSIFDIANGLGLTRAPEVVPISTKDYPTAAQRPPFSALDCSRIQENFGIHPSPWKPSLERTIYEICKPSRY